MTHGMVYMRRYMHIHLQVATMKDVVEEMGTATRRTIVWQGTEVSAGRISAVPRADTDPSESAVAFLCCSRVDAFCHAQVLLSSTCICMHIPNAHVRAVGGRLTATMRKGPAVGARYQARPRMRHRRR